MDDALARAQEIVAHLAHLRASQCRNCGLVYDNGWGTHKPRGLFRRPRCKYDPVGWPEARKHLLKED